MNPLDAWIVPVLDFLAAVFGRIRDAGTAVPLWIWVVVTAVTILAAAVTVHRRIRGNQSVTPDTNRKAHP